MRALVCAALGLVFLASGCVDPVTGQSHPALHERRDAIERIAVAPFALPEGRESDETLADGARLVERFLAEAFGTRGVEVVPAADVTLALTGFDELRPKGRQWAAFVGEEFGVQAVVTGLMRRYIERQGGAAGAQRPASVAFDVELYEVPQGRRLWSAVFDQTQKGMGENVLQTSRYPGGGMRWLRAAEFARWGAEETVRTSPLGTGP